MSLSPFPALFLFWNRGSRVEGAAGAAFGVKLQAEVPPSRLSAPEPPLGLCRGDAGLWVLPLFSCWGPRDGLWWDRASRSPTGASGDGSVTVIWPHLGFCFQGLAETRAAPVGRGDSRVWPLGKASVAGGAGTLPGGVCTVAAHAPEGGLGWERGHPRAEAWDGRREGASSTGLILPRSQRISSISNAREQRQAADDGIGGPALQRSPTARVYLSASVCPSVQVSTAEGASLTSLRSRSVSPKTFSSSSCSAPWLTVQLYPCCGDAWGV